MAKAPETIDGYIAARGAPVQDLLAALRALVHEALPGATEAMKWGAPAFFNAKGIPVIYLYGGKGHAHLGFVQGTRLTDLEGVLKGSGETGRHVKLLSTDAIPEAALKALVEQCAALD